MNSDPDEAVLERAAKRAQSYSRELVASLMAAWSRALPEEHLEDALSCSNAALTQLALCLRPRETRWTSDLDEIAGAIGIDRRRLEVFLRKALIAERLAISHEPDEHVDGRLMAARDRDETR
jgi:hypothetical protein